MKPQNFNFLFQGELVKEILCRVKYYHNSKRLILRVNKDHLVVSAPYNATPRKINSFIKEFEIQVVESLERHKIHQKNVRLKLPDDFDRDGTVPFLGKMIPLEVNFDNTLPCSFRFENEKITLTRKSLNTKLADFFYENLLWQFYFKEMKKIIEPVINHYSSVMEVPVKKVTIRSQKSRWGSFSRKGNMNLNWRLILAPQEVIKSVIIHELCHFYQMNHSAQFYQILEKYDPNHRTSTLWLKEHGHELMNIFSLFGKK